LIFFQRGSIKYIQRLKGAYALGGCLLFLLITGLFAPFLFFLIFFNIATLSLTKLGLTPHGAVLLFTFILIGSIINIPVSRKRFYVEEPTPFRYSFLYYRPPRVREQVIAVNVGGAVIPTVFSLYLLFNKAPLFPAIIATAIVALVCKRMAKLVPGVGIKIPALVPPIVAAVLAFILAGGNAAPVAFISGALGTLIGADLLNLHRMNELGAQVLSIGGAGVFDGIFLVGMAAAFLT
jgi:uncharacterized membrane protein